MIQCPLCGYRFKLEEGLGKCRGCMFSRGCKMVCCPNCGYSFPQPKNLKLFWRGGGDE